MNDTNQHTELENDEALAPLDAFEQQWVDQLAQRAPDLVQTEDAFVQSVMQQAEAASAVGSSPAVLARIGGTALPYAAAAALLLAAYVGWAMWIGETSSTTDQPEIANQSNNPTQPEDAAPVVSPDRPKVALGTLIANAKATATEPANTLTSTVSEAPKALSVDRLFDLLGDSVPDLKEILAPLEPKREQSRA